MTVAHSPIYNPLGVSRVRLIIADADDQEQDSYFMVVLMPNGNLANRFILIPETELKWVQEWKAKANGG